jgi:amino acid transporter
LRQELLRRKPVRSHDGLHAAGDVGEHLPRSIGTFQLAMFGVGATIGTGIFFVLSAAVPEAGPAVIVSFVVAGIAAGLAAICYAEMASSVPVSGSTYSYAYATLGEIVAMGVAAGLLRSTASRRRRSRSAGAAISTRPSATSPGSSCRTRSSRRHGTPIRAWSTCLQWCSSGCACSC